MQSQYGVSEMQQFMADGGFTPLFSSSPADINQNSYPPQKHHLLLHPHTHLFYQQQQLLQPQQEHHHHHQQPQLPPPPQLLHHFHPVPITQQLFQQTHQFHLFQQEQHRRIQQQQQQLLQLQQEVHLGLYQESADHENAGSSTRFIDGDGSSGGGVAAAAAVPLLGAMNFKLALDESCGGGGSAGAAAAAPFLGTLNFELAADEGGGGGGNRDELNDDEGILQGDDGSDSRVLPWQREDESAIKQPFWRPLDIDYINPNNKRCKDKHQVEPPNSNKHCKTSKEVDEDRNTSTTGNYKLFSELEAIYKPSSSGGGGSSGGSAEDNPHLQAGSGSALTGENPPTISTAAVDPNAVTGDHVASDTSTGEEAAPVNKYQNNGGGGGGDRRKRRRRRQLNSITAFFEILVARLMEHQEGLHRKFMEVMETRDQERLSREEARRQEAAAKSTTEAKARAQEQALASTREATIVSFLEKLTGERLDLPTRAQFQSKLPEEAQNAAAANNNNNNSDQGLLVSMNRWPKSEVQTLIRVRSGFEARFQEPGLKAPLWEEVSGAMAAMGYRRSSKRCKEKWENINKYFRKTKDSAKRRPNPSKTCPYFHQLDQLYSTSNSKSLDKTPAAAAAAGDKEDNSELLDAIVVNNDQVSSSFEIPGMGSLRLDFDGDDGGGDKEASGSATAGQGQLEFRQRGEPHDAEENGEDEEEEEDGDGGEVEEEGGGDAEEGEGESQERAAPPEPGHSPHDSVLFFCRIES